MRRTLIPLAMALFAGLGGPAAADCRPDTADGRSGAWKAAAAGCRAIWAEAAPRREGGRLLRLGRLVAGADRNLPDKLADLAFARLPAVLDEAARSMPAAALGLAGLRRLEVVLGDSHSRYVGWAPGDDARLRVSAAAFLDPDPAHLVRAVAHAAARRAARRHPGVDFEDPYVRRVDGMTLQGSVYPDVDNAPFFAAMRRVLRMADRLPPDLRRYVEAVDIIHYNPRSEHFARLGPGSTAVALYDARLGGPGLRPIFVRQAMRWTSDAGLLLYLVHEGTHAVQHAEVDRMRDALASERRRLRTATDDPDEAETLRRSIARRQDMVEAWHGDRRDAQGLTRRMRFECAATLNEVEAARHLDLPPALVEDSQYLKHCDAAAAQVAQWRDARLQKGLKRARGE